jgi:hypothetical protein
LTAPLLALWLAGLCSTTLRAEDPAFELSQLPPAAEGAIDYEQQIAPLLANKCASCHGAKRQRSDLRVDTRGALLKGGSRGPAAVPSQPARSWLLAAASRQIEELAMPPEGEPLTADEVALLPALRLDAAPARSTGWLNSLWPSAD